MTEIFERGASTTHRGVTVAFALASTGGPGAKQLPDTRRFFLRHGDTWELVDLHDMCAAAHAPLPHELTQPFFSTAYGEQLLGVARCIAGLRLSPAPQPLPTPSPSRGWWLQQEDTP